MEAAQGRTRPNEHDLSVGAAGHALLVLLSAAGLAATGYLAWAGLVSGRVAGCGAGQVFDCSHVLTSRWSKVIGMPVAVPAFALYSVLLSALWFTRRSVPADLRRLSWTCVMVCGLAAGLSAVWFIGLQTFALEHYCLWCLVAHTCSLLICAVLLWQRPPGMMPVRFSAAGAVVGVGLLAAVQSLTPVPPTWEEEHYDVVTDLPSQIPGGSDDTGDQGASFGQDPEAFVFSPPDVSSAESLPDSSPGVLFEPPAAAERPEPIAPSPESVLPSEDGPAAPEGSPSDVSAATTLLLLPAPRVLLRLSAVPFMLTDSTDGNDDSPEKKKAAEAADSGRPAETDGESHRSGNSETDGTSAEDRKSAPPGPARRLVGVKGNRFVLDVRQWPLLGKPDAKYVFVEMFDYTCPHCRRTHQAIRGAFERLGDDLAVIALPVPLDRKCNSAVRSGGGAHRHSCEISRIAVAVWRIDPEKFHRLHDWIFERSRTADATRRQAERLVGADVLKEELNRGVADQYIARHVELYRRVGAGKVPKLMFPKTSLVGEISSAEVLTRRILRELNSPVSSQASNDQ